MFGILLTQDEKKIINSGKDLNRDWLKWKKDEKDSWNQCLKKSQLKGMKMNLKKNMSEKNNKSESLFKL